jgi:hypothetical protein
MGPKARKLYDRFESMIASCGEYHVAPAKSRIAFMAYVRFAGITKLNEEEMICNFSLPQRLRSSRVAKTEEVVPGWWVHQLRITDPNELNREVQKWIQESYRLMGMRQRLGK